MKHNKIIGMLLAGSIITAPLLAPQNTQASQDNYKKLYLPSEAFQATDFYKYNSYFTSTEYSPTELMGTDGLHYVSNISEKISDNVVYIDLQKWLDFNPELKEETFNRIVYVAGYPKLSVNRLQEGALEDNSYDNLVYNVAHIVDDVEIVAFSSIYQGKYLLGEHTFKPKVNVKDLGDGYIKVTLDIDKDLKKYRYVGLRWKYGKEAQDKVNSLGNRKNGAVVALDSLEIYSSKNEEVKVNEKDYLSEAKNKLKTAIDNAKEERAKVKVSQRSGYDVPKNEKWVDIDSDFDFEEAIQKAEKIYKNYSSISLIENEIENLKYYQNKFISSQRNGRKSITNQNENLNKPENSNENKDKNSNNKENLDKKDVINTNKSFEKISFPSELFASTNSYTYNSYFTSTQFLAENLRDFDGMHYVSNISERPDKALIYADLKQALLFYPELANSQVNRIVYTAGYPTLSVNQLQEGILDTNNYDNLVFNIAHMTDDVELVCFDRLYEGEPLYPTYVKPNIKKVENLDSDYIKVTIDTDFDLKKYKYIGLKWNYSEKAQEKVNQLNDKKNGAIVAVDSLEFYSSK